MLTTFGVLGVGFYAILGECYHASNVTHSRITVFRAHQNRPVSIQSEARLEYLDVLDQDAPILVGPDVNL